MEQEQLGKIIGAEDGDCCESEEMFGASQDWLLEEGLEGKKLNDDPIHRLIILFEQEMK